ncbi:MAG: hypothetical protein K6T92_07960, partial [Candidatus Rokubacteria bacterium]|nr:hypothetical protein [Candidatus Rokubacteria bacterium]
MTRPRGDGGANAAGGGRLRTGALQTIRRGLALSPELRRGLAGTLGLATIAMVGRVAVPVAVQQVIDRGFRAPGGPDTGVVLGTVTAALAVLALTTVAASLMMRRLFTVSETALTTVRTRAFRHIHDLSMLHQQGERRGALTSRVTTDVDQITQLLQLGGVTLLVSSAQIVVTSMVMFVYSWQLALVVYASFLPLVVIVRLLQRRLAQAYLLVRERVGAMLAAIAETVVGSDVIRAYGVAGRGVRRLDAGQGRIEQDRAFGIDVGRGQPRRVGGGGQDLRGLDEPRPGACPGILVDVEVARVHGVGAGDPIARRGERADPERARVGFALDRQASAGKPAPGRRKQRDGVSGPGPLAANLHRVAGPAGVVLLREVEAETVEIAHVAGGDAPRRANPAVACRNDADLEPAAVRPAEGGREQIDAPQAVRAGGELLSHEAAVGQLAHRRVARSPRLDVDRRRHEEAPVQQAEQLQVGPRRAGQADVVPAGRRRLDAGRPGHQLLVDRVAAKVVARHGLETVHPPDVALDQPVAGVDGREPAGRGAGAQEGEGGRIGIEAVARHRRVEPAARDHEVGRDEDRKQPGGAPPSREAPPEPGHGDEGGGRQHREARKLRLLEALEREPAHGVEVLEQDEA